VSAQQERMLRITLVRSPIGRQPVQRRTVRALGLKRLNHSVVHRDTPEIAGMIARVRHLVDVQPWEEEKKKKASPAAGKAETPAGEEKEKKRTKKEQEV